jgi:nitroreductase
LDTLFREARTHATLQPRPVADQTLRDLYDLLKWAPTIANAAPARFAFLRSKEAKERLRPALAPMIPPDAQRVSKRAGSTVAEVNGSHAVYVSQPKAVASLIERAASGEMAATV